LSDVHSSIVGDPGDYVERFKLAENRLTRFAQNNCSFATYGGHAGVLTDFGADW
jgi:hypothetical protein